VALSKSARARRGAPGAPPPAGPIAAQSGQHTVAWGKLFADVQHPPSPASADTSLARTLSLRVPVAIRVKVTTRTRERGASPSATVLATSRRW